MSDHNQSSSSTPNHPTDLDEYHATFASKYPFDPAAMEVAFQQARKALEVGEAAIGCVFIDMSGNNNNSNNIVSTTTASSSTHQQLKYGRVAAVGHNLTNAEHNALAHAEFVAIRSILENKSIPDCQSSSAEESKVVVAPPTTTNNNNNNEGPPLYVLYVTVEPCIMCGSMLAQSGMVAGVYFGCSNPRFGGNGTVLSVHRSLTPIPASTSISSSAKCSNFKCYYASIGGYRAEEAVGLLQNFYSLENPGAPDERRKKKPNQDGNAQPEQ